MADTTHTDGGEGRRLPLRLIGWSIPVVLLSIPLIADFPWTLSDFIVMGVLFGIVGLLLELVARASPNWAYRGGAALAVLGGFLLIWVNLAVGFLGDEGNPANLMFFGVILFAIAAAFVGRFRAAGMARAMFVTAAAQVLVAVFGLVAGMASPGGQGLYEVVLGSTLFGGMWLVSGALFHVAARQGA